MYIVQVPNHITSIIVQMPIDYFILLQLVFYTYALKHCFTDNKE